MELIQGRPFNPNDIDQFNFYAKRSRSLLQQNNEQEDCFIGSPQVLEEYPSIVTVRNALDRVSPNTYLLAGGVLLDTQKVLTTAAVLWTNVPDNAVPFNLIDQNPVNRTVDIEFLAAIGPYCTHGNGSEVVSILGYHYMEDQYNGFPADGFSIAVLDLENNVTSLTPEEIPSLRQTALSPGDILTMVGHGALNASQSLIQTRTSEPPKIIQYETISETQCQRFISRLGLDKQLDQATESCAVVSELSDVWICNGDDGNPLFDADGNLAGIVTWWAVNDCSVPRDETMPIVFADVTKQRVQEFIELSYNEPLTIPPNFADGCADGQTLQNAPYAVSLQQTRPADQSEYFHFCGGVLIDEGRRVLTTAQCVWNEFIPPNLDDGTDFNIMDLRDYDYETYEQTQEGSFFVPIFATLAPRCRHLNGLVDRILVTEYVLHPNYDGNPQNGYDVAIMTLAEPFDSDLSFPNFLQFLRDSEITAETQFSETEFFGWGAYNRTDASDDDSVFWNNYFPAKEISTLELISDSDCTQRIVTQNSKETFNDQTDVCALQTSQADLQNICIHDNGSPLVGRLTSQDELALIGLKAGNQERTCIDSISSPEVFVDITAVKDFILQHIDPEYVFPSPPPPLETPPPPSSGSDSTPAIIAAVVVAVVAGIILIILITAIVMFRRRKQEQEEFLKELRIVELDATVSQIHTWLKMLALKFKNPKTGMVRSHSDLSASLDFLLSSEKVETQILGYTNCGRDDTYVQEVKGAIPTSPFILAAMKNKGSNTATNISFGEDDKNFAQPIQRQIPLLGDAQFNGIQARMVEMSLAMKQFSDSAYEDSIGSSSLNLITNDTPAREDFDLEIDFEKDLEIKERLGTGAFGSVYRALWRNKNGQKLVVAVKVIHAHILEQLMDDMSSGGTYFNSIIGELQLLSRLDNPRIVKSYGASFKRPNVCLVLEYLSQGSLDKLIHNYVGDLPIPLVLRVAQGIAEGLDALHPTVVHRDLKPQNVLLDENYAVKLADFGMSKIKEDSYLSETMVKGTPAYIAPEAFKGDNVDEKCDIYALGLIIWEMVAKKRPWHDLNLPVVIMARVSIKGDRPTIPSSCPNDLKKLIEKCWAANPRERPSAHEVVQKLQLMRRTTKTAKSDHTAFQEYFGESMQNLVPSTQAALSSQVLSYNYSQFSIQSTLSEEKE